MGKSLQDSMAKYQKNKAVMSAADLKKAEDYFAKAAQFAQENGNQRLLEKIRKHPSSSADRSEETF